MGGNLFKVGRVSKDRYFEILESLRPTLTAYFGKSYHIPLAYKNKADYGDVDIIVDAAFVLNKPNWKKELQELLGVKQVQSVRNVFSMLYMNFQVDVFLVSTRRFESTYNFMCYNVLGNLIGRIYHKFNLRYGEDGLFYVLRGFNNHISREVSVSRDFGKILSFVGLSYDRWKEGFDDLEDIFKYVIESKYFCSNSYDPGYFNIRKRIERPDFVKFLEYLENNKIEKNFPFQKPKEIYLDMIDEFFKTDLKGEFEKHNNRQEILLKMSKKFNGNIVMETIGLEGAELGKFIGTFKKSFGTEEVFEKFILESNKPKIIEEILKQYKHGIEA